MWKDLSMSERAALIKLGVDNGVYDINEIKDSYNKYKDGGYKPSSSIRKRISNWEGSSMKTNRSFEAEARDFNASLPKGATDKLTQEQLDGLYSYSYNVGAGNFRKRVNPALTRYLAGEGTIQDVQRSMWASKDSQLRGLARRRNAERAMLGSYNPVEFSNNLTRMMINNLPSENELVGIPELHYDIIEPSSPINIPEIEPVEEVSTPSVLDVMSMLQMVKKPNKINIYR